MCSDHDRQPLLVHTQKFISYLHCSTSLWTLITDGVKWLLELCHNYFKNPRHGSAFVLNGGGGALRNVNLLTRTLEFCNYTSKSWKLFMFSLFNMNIAYSSQWTELLVNCSNRNQSKNTRHTKQKHICMYLCRSMMEWKERRDLGHPWETRWY